MTGIEYVIDEPTQQELEQQVAAIGQFAALSYAQRVVGHRETGTLSPDDAEQINACDTANFLRCYGNLIKAHKSQQNKPTEA